MRLYSAFCSLNLFVPTAVNNHVTLKYSWGLSQERSLGSRLSSVFEAWWVAPGSAEAVYFWGIAAVGLGLAQRSLSASKTSNRQALISAFYPAGFPPRRSVEG